MIDGPGESEGGVRGPGVAYAIDNTETAGSSLSYALRDVLMLVAGEAFTPGGKPLERDVRVKRRSLLETKFT